MNKAAVAVRTSATQSLSSEDLARRALQRRAVEAVIWGTPAVNFDVMYQAMVRDAKAGEGSNKIVYWSRLFDWKNQTLTPNPDSIYFIPFFNTKDAGPIVLEIPPADDGSITGSLDDCWQTSATVYGCDTHSLIRNMKRASRSSQNPELQKNDDGSVDIYFGPKTLAGKESNWVPTSADGEFEVLFRFYGPEKPLFDKTWKLPDIEKT